MRRRGNGPGAFLASLGAVLFLSGLLVFLSVPAARVLDRKEARQSESALDDARERSVVKSGIVVLATGAALVAWGATILRFRA